MTAQTVSHGLGCIDVCIGLPNNLVRRALFKRFFNQNI